MHEVLIILTAHRERRKFRAQFLTEILDMVGPEAIFLEHSTEEYEKFDVLEKKSVSLYLRQNQIPVFPCGEYFPEEKLFEFHRKYMELCRALEQYGSEDYRARYDNHVQRESLEGFLYLHSKEYGEMQRWLHQEEERIVRSINGQEIFQLLQWWSQLQRSREKSILTAVENMVLDAGYKKVALLIGAEHRNSFLDSSKEFSRNKIKWSCYEYNT